jgi:adenylate cyclase
MKYQTKLYIYLTGTAAISSLVGFGFLLGKFREHLFQDQQMKAMTVAATTAALIDTDMLKQIDGPPSEQTEAYTYLKNQLIKARDANRRQDVEVYFLYTLKPDPNKAGEFVYAVDAEEDPSWVSHSGDKLVPGSAAILRKHLFAVYSPGKFVADWGEWTTGYAPIYDSDGKFIGTVGADISIARFVQFFNRILQSFIVGIGVALLLAVLGGRLLAKQISSSLQTLVECVGGIGRGDLNASAGLKTRDEFQGLSKEIDHMTAGLRERERLKLNFARYVSQQVMEKILKTEDIDKLAGERRKITVLFSDIRQFTKLAESLPPEQVVSLLNAYFEAMLKVIFRHQGILDKFLGDGMMVEFGTPADDPMQEKHAVMTALEMQQELKKLTAKWRAEGKPTIEIGIGVHTGLAVVGNIGTEERIEYTAVGDTINIAARLEQTTKLLKKPILISETTYMAIKDEFQCESMGPMILSGRTTAIGIYAPQLE